MANENVTSTSSGNASWFVHPPTERDIMSTQPESTSPEVVEEQLHSLRAGAHQAIVEVGTGVPELVWLGAPITGALETLSAVRNRPIPNASISSIAPATLLPIEADGWVGAPGIEGQRPDGSAWSPRFVLSKADVEPSSIIVTGIDDRCGLAVVTRVALTASGVVTTSVELHNEGDTDYSLQACRLTVPVGEDIVEVQVPEGRWVHEFQEVRLPWRAGAIEQTNRRGRTSHDKPPWIMAGTAGFTNGTGKVWGAHLGWSGNVSVRAEVLTDGRRILQLGELLLSGDVVLSPGEQYNSPTMYLAASDSGMNGVSHAFHGYIRARPQHDHIRSDRPVHMNTWEAVYFFHDLEVLKGLADKAAEVGAERYVLDDGWFHGRRSDNAGLGDWWVDDSVWPNGLAPLISHVTSLGMQFGIWVEPEMVNPNSDLFGAHPEWVLGGASDDPVMGRNQLVLDLTIAEAFSYVFGHLDRLLENHDVSYVKWDMNRDLTRPGSGTGSRARSQTLAVYRMIDMLREKHPDVEIETCSSRGGRADLGILERTDRIWTSDSNDALARQRIQRGFLRWFPPELMGAHVGPPVSHTSGRQMALGFRGATALFGHLGIEWNLQDASAEDRAQLTEIISFHKEHRALLHTGVVWQLDTTDPGLLAMGVVAANSAEALYSVAQLETARYGVPERLRLSGLDPEQTYSVTPILLSDAKLGLAVRQPEWVTTGVEAATGNMLTTHGLQLPCLDPETALLLHVSAVG